MFSSHSSLRRELVKAIKAAFAALYMVWNAIGDKATPEETLTM